MFRKVLTIAVLAAGVIQADAAGKPVLGTKPAPKPEARRSALPFVDDNYQTALTQAREKKVPLFVEAWAPW